MQQFRASRIYSADSSSEDENPSPNEIEQLASAEDNMIDINRTYFLQSQEASFAEISMDLETTLQSSSCGEIDAPAEANATEVKEQLFDGVNSLYCLDDAAASNANIQGDRLIVSLSKLKELKGFKCKEVFKGSELCGKDLKFTETLRGGVVKLRWSCIEGHFGMWVSSEVATQTHYSDVYMNDLLITACIILSGNSYNKFVQFANFLNLAVPDQSVFCRNQRLFVIPVVLDMWQNMKAKVVEVLGAYSSIVLGGDGRNDSPGFSARYCVYVLMDLVSNFIVDIETLDKRETGGVSTNMEREGLTRILLRLMKSLDINEIATDASSSIMKRVEELRGNKLFYSKCTTFQKLSITLQC